MNPSTKAQGSFSAAQGSTDDGSLYPAGSGQADAGQAGRRNAGNGQTAASRLAQYAGHGLTSGGIGWTMFAVAAWMATWIVPEWHPEWFVSSSGQITVAFEWFGAFIAVGLAVGWRWARWIALAFLAVSVLTSLPLVLRLFEGSPNFVNRYAMGYALLVGLDVIAFSILAFVPAVRDRFSRDASSGNPRA